MRRPGRRALNFNPRSHAGSDARSERPGAEIQDFNPRSHAGSDGSEMPAEIRAFISIHAPTRGATLCDLRHKREHWISIHAPTRGATAGLVSLFQGSLIFQSTLPRGERRQPGFYPPLPVDFNPRSHAGSDARRFVFVFWPRRFQSTLPRGERLCRAGGRRGRDGISIHAPTRGATLTVYIDALYLIFQSTLPRGERPQYPSSSPTGAMISIHAPTRGATTNRPATTRARRISIHAPTRGATATPSACPSSLP